MPRCKRRLPRARQRRSGATFPMRLVLALVAALIAFGCRSDIQAKLEEARALRERGRVPDAIAVLREVLEDDPNQAAANYALGAVLLQSGQQKLAITHLRKAETATEQAVPAGLLLASAYVASRDFQRAIETANRVLERNEEQTAAVRLRATSHLGTGEWEQVIADADRIIEIEGSDTQALALRGTALMQLGRLDEAESVFLGLRESGRQSEDPAAAARGCLAYASFLAEGRRDVEGATAEIEACLEAHPSDGLVVSVATRFFDAWGQQEKSLALLRRVLRDAPESLGARVQLAQRLAADGRLGEGDALLREATELSDTPPAWQALGAYRRQHADVEGAISALSKAAELAPAPADPTLFLLADLLVEAGRIDEAEETSRRLELPVYRDLVRGRVLLARDQPEAALAALESGLRVWPNNAGARFLAGQAAQELGDRERALEEFRAAAQADAKRTDAALMAARLHYQRGELDEALRHSRLQLEHRSTRRREAVVIAARCHLARRDADAAVAVLDSYVEAHPGDPVAVVERARAIEQASGHAAALRALEESGLDLAAPANARALRALAQVLLAQGRGREALERADAALRRHPDQPVFHALRGRVLAALERGEEARAALERALELEPEHAPALLALGSLHARQGEAALALELYERAADVEPGEPEYGHAAASALMQAGREEDAEKRLRAVVLGHPAHVAACNDLAWLLAEQDRDLDFALELAERAARLAPAAEVLDTLGWVQLRRGDVPAAVATLRRALEVAPDAPGARYRLGLALARSGEPDAALDELHRALRAGPFPEASEARARIAELERQEAPAE